MTNKNPPSGQRLAVTGGIRSKGEAVSKWFPALSGQISLATRQGYE